MVDFYKAMLKQGIFTERRDFIKVPPREVFEKYQKYLDLPQGKRRDDYRWDNLDLDAWLVLKFDYTPIVEKRRRAELTPTEKATEEIQEREREFEESWEEVEKKLKELTD